MKIESKQDDNIIVVTPEAEITADDIATLNSRVDVYISTYGKIPNIVIHAPEVPHWKNFHALASHIRFVEDHQKLIKKVAIVSDSELLWLARGLVDHFVGAKVRRFPLTGLEDAIAWAKADDDHPGKLEVMDFLPEDVIGVRAEGIVTAQDYRKTLIPLVEARAAKFDKLKMVYVIGEEFDGFSAGAMWHDTRFGLTHLTTFSKLAVVTDIEWIRHSVKMFGHLMPTEVMVFDLADLEDATAWITS